MEAMLHMGTSDRYMRRIAGLGRIGWNLDRDVSHAGKSDAATTVLPDGLSTIERLPLLGASEKRLLSQIQGRTYANIFGLVQRLIAARLLEVSGDQPLSDQLALEALARLRDEFKRQDMFRHIERMAAAAMPDGYAFLPEPNAVASLVLGKSSWSVLALICHIELFVLTHYRESLDLHPDLSALCKDVFLCHWREESKHAVHAELEWARENERITAERRDRAVDSLVELVVAVDEIVQKQSESDVDYFLRICGRTFSRDEARRIRAGVLDAYRRPYCVSGVRGRFDEVLSRFITPAQHERVGKALSPVPT